MTPPRAVLMMVSQFGLDEGSRGLFRDLADALVRRGARVRVLLLDWKHDWVDRGDRVVLDNGIEVLIVQPIRWAGGGRVLGGALRWFASSARAVTPMRRHWRGERFDTVFVAAPLVVSTFAILTALRRHRARSIAYVTDFFPQAHRRAGLIPGGLFYAACLRLEEFLMRRFDVLAAMSPAGVAYFRDHYRLSSRQELAELRLWGDPEPLDPAPRDEVRRALDLPLDRGLVLFGGQLAEGRGVEEMLAAAALARDVAPDLLFVFMGTGRLEPLVAAAIAGGADNVVLRPPLPRQRYLDLAAASDVGIVCTPADTGVPTFPSKTIDYLRVGLPVAAAVEDTTDYLDFVNAQGFGRAVVTGDPRTFLGAIVELAALDRAAVRGRSRATLEAFFDVNRAAAQVLTMGAGAGTPR